MCWDSVQVLSPKHDGASWKQSRHVTTSAFQKCDPISKRGGSPFIVAWATLHRTILQEWYAGSHLLQPLGHSPPQQGGRKGGAVAVCRSLSSAQTIEPGLISRKGALGTKCLGQNVAIRACQQAQIKGTQTYCRPLPSTL